MRVILLFLDGVGIGKNDSSINPFFRSHLPTFVRLLGEIPHLKHKAIDTEAASCRPVNATLGIPGLPQSGTGQTAIFTGVNGARLFGRHFGPYPPSGLRKVIKDRNIFQQLLKQGKSVVFANAFPQRFFDYVLSGTRRLSVTTLSCMESGVELLTAEHLRNNQAVSAELTRERWPELGYPDLKPVRASEAGEHLWNMACKKDFTLFEYWLTDHAGHKQEMEGAVQTLQRFDEFLGGFLNKFDYDTSLLVLISDHGNIEDLSTKSHTRNPVPCIAVGNQCRAFLSKVKNLTHITPAVLSLLQ